MVTIVTRAGKGAALTWTEGDANITNLNNGKLENVVEDLTPQLGGNLDVNGKQIVSTANGNIAIVPDGSGNIQLTPASGKVVISATNFPTGTGSSGQVLQTDGTGNASWATPAGVGGATTLNELTDVVITAAATNDVLVFDGTNWVDTPASNLGVYSAMAIDINTTDGSASDTTMYPVLVGSNITGSAFPHIDSSGLSFNASTNTLTAAAFSGALNGTVGGTTPAAGTFTNLSAAAPTGFSALTLNGAGVTLGYPNLINGGPRLYLPVAQGNGTLENVNVGASYPGTGKFTTLTADTTTLDDIRETVFSIGTTVSGTITPDAANGSIQTFTITGNTTLNAFANPVSGQTITFIITQGSTGGFTLTSTMKFAGASKTLSTAIGAIDILTVSYIGTTYYASLSKGFA